MISDRHIDESDPKIPGSVSGMIPGELESCLIGWGLKKFHARQILAWIHRRRVLSFAGMTDLSLDDRAILSRRLTILSSKIGRRIASSDGTEKFLICLRDGERIETALIREPGRNTLCLSTQVGCPIRCVFCASGMKGLSRNLDAAEIVEQFLQVSAALAADERLNNIVLMGIGEPLLNLQHVVRALTILHAKWGAGVGYHRITLSTVGILNKIDELVATGVHPNLACSLHASNDEVRRRLIPTLQTTVSDIVRKGLDYRAATGKDVTFEYVLLRGVNDSTEHARELSLLLRGGGCKVNLIPYNSVEGAAGRPPESDVLSAFVDILREKGVSVTVRKTKGSDIAAACGQLRIDAERSSKAVGEKSDHAHR
ncbi:MAG: 23S rRNA (adenine(2503)-C(2))-methyltransferase [Planctomycetes bacterium RBG_16_59_8]|nr:MAG: 23S rRNA (adenine(2503)-C(2))-methyltransferase [Planctomycetes bacterium RBG_16_59_8]